MSTLGGRPAIPQRTALDFIAAHCDTLRSQRISGSVFRRLEREIAAIFAIPDGVSCWVSFCVNICSDLYLVEHVFFFEDISVSDYVPLLKPPRPPGCTSNVSLSLTEVRYAPERSRLIGRSRRLSLRSSFRPLTKLQKTGGKRLVSPSLRCSAVGRVCSTLLYPIGIPNVSVQLCI